MLTELLMGRLVCISNRQVSRGTRRKSDRVTKFFFFTFNGEKLSLSFSTPRRRRGSVVVVTELVFFLNIFFPSSLFWCVCLFPFSSDAQFRSIFPFRHSLPVPVTGTGTSIIPWVLLQFPLVLFALIQRQFNQLGCDEPIFYTTYNLTCVHTITILYNYTQLLLLYRAPTSRLDNNQVN